jgi:MSHA biogenesis protein MshK
VSRILVSLFILGLTAPASGLADPTRPPAGVEAPTGTPAPPTPSAPRLSSILYSAGPGERARVRINGTWLRAGEEKDGLRILRIERRRVIVQQDGDRHELTLDGPAPIKRPAAEKEHP